jgi:hypothetical protein
MLRFSIRDLLWLMLVVAVALGWFVREWQLREKADLAINDARFWRGGAGALELHLETDQGVIVTWDMDKWEARVFKLNILSTYDLRACEPNPDLSALTVGYESVHAE